MTLMNFQKMAMIFYLGAKKLYYFVPVSDSSRIIFENFCKRKFPQTRKKSLC